MRNKRARILRFSGLLLLSLLLIITLASSNDLDELEIVFSGENYTLIETTRQPIVFNEPVLWEAILTDGIENYTVTYSTPPINVNVSEFGNMFIWRKNLTFSTDYTEPYLDLIYTTNLPLIDEIFVNTDHEYERDGTNMTLFLPELISRDFIQLSSSFENLTPILPWMSRLYETPSGTLNATLVEGGELGDFNLDENFSFKLNMLPAPNENQQAILNFSFNISDFAAFYLNNTLSTARIDLQTISINLSNFSVLDYIAINGFVSPFDSFNVYTDKKSYLLGEQVEVVVTPQNTTAFLYLFDPEGVVSLLSDNVFVPELIGDYVLEGSIHFEDYIGTRTAVFSVVPNSSSLVTENTSIGVFSLESDVGEITFFEINEDLVATFVVDHLNTTELFPVQLNLPFKIPEGMHIYYWKNVSGEQIQVPYNLSENRTALTLWLQDGVIDNDGMIDGRVIDPLKIHMPDYEVLVNYVDEKTARALIDDRSVSLKTSSGILSDLSVVDPRNVPGTPVDSSKFSHKMIKFSVENLSLGEEIEVELDYDELGGDLTLWKFNPNNVSWYEFPHERDGNKIILTLVDGGLGDDDGVANGIIVDDLGITTNWWNSSWYRRLAINISNTAQNVSDYQVKITLNSSNFNFSKAMDNLSDLRFFYYNSSDDSETKMSYWMESNQTANYSGGSFDAIFWTKVPFLENNTETTLLIYYQNPDATSESDGNATFAFFDDASGTYSDLWTDIQGSGSYGTVGGKQAISLDSANTNIRTTNFQMNESMAIEGEMYSTAVITAFQYYQDSNPSTNEHYHARIDVRTGQSEAILEDAVFTGSQTDTFSSTSTWVDVELYVDQFGNHNLYVGGSLSDTRSTDTTYTSGYLALNHHNSGTGGVANLRVRKYVTPEPGIASVVEDVGGNLSSTVLNPVADSDEDKYQTFTMNGTINCTYGNCGDVDAYFQYFSTISPIQTITETTSSDFESNYSSENITVSDGHFSINSNVSGSPWWDSQWLRRQLINVSSTNNISDYQNEIILNSSLVGGNFSWSDNDSIRFVQYHSSNSSFEVLPFYIRSWDNSSQTANITVRFSYVNASSTNSVYMYYDNSLASLASNATETFILYSSGDSLSGWTNNGASIYGSGNPGNAIEATGATYAYQDIGLDENYTIEMDVYVINGANDLANIFFLVDSAGQGQMFRVESRGGNSPGFASTSSWSSWNAPSGYTPVSVSTWHNVRIEINDTSATGYIDGSSFGTYSYSNNGGYIGVHGDSGAVAGGRFDNIFVSKLASQEPTETFGEEETISFEPSGQYISSYFDLGSWDTDFGNITWSSANPANTTMTVYTRVAKNPGDSWWDEDWEYRNKVNISNTAGDLTDFQVGIEINTTELYNAGKISANCSDIRVARYSSGWIEMSHWVESCNITGGNSTVWIKYPSLLNDTTVEVELYYGNPSASDTGNIDSVMAGNGLRYFYYDGNSFGTYQGNDVDTSIDHDWGGGTVEINGNSWEDQSQSMSLRYEGWVVNKGSGDHTFYTASDDGNRLYVEGNLVTNDWTGHSFREVSGTYNMSRPVPVTFEFFENSGDARIRFSWEPADGTGRVDPIPSTYLKYRKYANPYPTATYGSEENVNDTLNDPDVLGWSPWYLEANSTAIQSPASRFIQYRVDMSNDDQKASPTVNDVSLEYSILSTGWKNMTSSTTDFTTNNPYSCGSMLANETCTPTRSVLPRSIGEFDVRICAYSQSLEVDLNCSQGVNITVWSQPTFSNYIFSKSTVGRNQTVDITVKLLDDDSNIITGANISFVDLTGNGTSSYSIGSAVTDGSGIASISYTVPSDGYLGTHTVQAYYDGNVLGYVRNATDTQTVEVSSVPQLNLITANPQKVGFGYNVTVTVNVTDEKGLDSVKINITEDGSSTLYDMTPGSGDLYTYTYNNTWDIKTISYTIIANNTDGIEITSPSQFFQVEVYANINFTTEKDYYKNYEQVDLDTDVNSWQYAGWDVRLPFSLNGHVEDLYNYPVRIDLDSSNFVFNSSDENGSDIRFAYYNKSSGTELNASYWIVNWNSTTESATIYVNVPYLENSTSETVYMYFGNTGASSESNFTNAIIGNGTLDGSGYARYQFVGMKWQGGDTDCTSDASFDPATIYPYDGATMGSDNWDPGSFWGVFDTYDNAVNGGYSAGAIDFDDVWGSDIDDSESYMGAYIWSPDDRTVTIGAGSDDTRVMWVESTEVHSDCVDQGLSVDDSTFPASFQKGRNRIIMMVNEDGGGYGGVWRVTVNDTGLRYMASIAQSEPTAQAQTVETYVKGVQNLGITDIKGYLRMYVEEWTGSDWQFLAPTVIDSELYSIDAYSALNVSEEWINEGSWDVGTRSSGTYRVYAELLDPSNNVLVDSDGDSLVYSYNFTVLEAILIPTNVTHENEYDYSLTEYETGDVIDWINVTVQTINNTAFDAQVTLSIINQTSGSESWGPSSTKSCGTISENSTCQRSWDNSSNGYIIPNDVSSGTYTFYWNIDMNASNGPLQNNNSVNFTIHSIPSNFSKSLTRTRLYKPNWTYYNFTFTNLWSQNITDVNVTINCPSATDLQCNSTATGKSWVSYATIGSSVTTTVPFNISVTNLTPSSNYPVNITITYTNPGGENKNWSGQLNEDIEVRSLGILEINPYYYASNVTRGLTTDVYTSANNTGDFITSNAVLNYTLPVGWSVYAGQKEVTEPTLNPSELFWNNVTLLAGISSGLGPQSIKINTSSDEGQYDWKTISITVYANTSLSFVSVPNEKDKGESVELQATLLYDNGSAISGATIKFYDNTSGTYLGQNTTNAAGLATYTYLIPLNSSLGAHTLNATYLGNPTKYLLKTYNETTLTVYEPPTISNINQTSTLIGFGKTVTINATIFDNDGNDIDTYLINITYPDGSTGQQSMSFTPPDFYEVTINNTWMEGQYNVTIWVNDSRGSIAESNIINFTVNASGTLSISPINYTYEPNNQVNITDAYSTWYDSSWDFRIPFNVTSNTDNLTDFQINTNVTISEYYNRSQIDENCSDVRFTYLNETSGEEVLIDFWIESCDTSDELSAWVEVPEISNTTNTQVYMYYGNPDATSLSNRTNTMIEGLVYQYYSGTNFNTFQGSDVDTSISHTSWGTGTVQINGNSWENLADAVSIRWSGWVINRGSGSHTFYTYSDDGNRLYVDGVLTVNDWSNHGGREASGSKNLTTYETVRFEFYESGGGASARLGWEPADGSGKVYPIPSSYLFSRKYASTEPTVTKLSSQSVGSQVRNNAHEFCGYVVLSVQSNNSGSWEHIDTIINHTATLNKSCFSTSEFALNLSDLWNPISWDTALNNPGFYRTYAEIQMPNGSVITTDEGPLSAYGIFEITTPPLNVELKQIRIYDVTDSSNKHYYTNELIDSGLNKTFIVENNREYRVELEYENIGESTWNISEIPIYHQGLSSSWAVDEADDIWYSNKTDPFDSRTDTSKEGGNFTLGTISWNVSNGGLVYTTKNSTFYYIVSINTTGDYQIIANITHPDFDDLDYSIIRSLDVDNDPPILFSDANYNVSPLNVTREDSFLLYARWNETVTLANASYTATTNLSYVTVTNSSASQPENWTNFTISTTSSWYLGEHSAKISAVDQSDNINDTLDYIYFDVYGVAQVISLNLNASNINVSDSVNISCRVGDDTDSDQPISGYNVTFFNSTHDLGSALTNSSGWASYLYIDNTPGQESVGCYVQENLISYYLIDSQNRSTTTLSTYEEEAPTYSTIIGPSLVHKGEYVDLKVNWSDNYLLDDSVLSINTTSWSNESSISLSGSNAWANFTYQIPTTLIPGEIQWKQYANDTSNNYNETPSQSITVWGYSSISTSTLSPSSIQETNVTKMRCLVQDSNSSTPINNYNVSFFYKLQSASSYTYLGSNTTTSDGYANFSFNVSTEGSYDIKCNITDDSSSQYNNTDSNYAIKTLNVVSGSDFLPPFIIGNNYSVNDSEVYIGECFTISGLWNEAINESWIEYNYSGSSVYRINISAPYTANWTNESICLNSSWTLQNYTFKLFAKDAAGNENNTLSFFNVLVKSKATLLWSSPSGNLDRDIHNISCRVIDNLTGLPIQNYPVTFYDGDTAQNLGTDYSNSSGYSQVSNDFSSAVVGPDLLSCVFDDEDSVFYDALSPKTVSNTVYFYGQLSANITKPANDTIIVRGTTIDLEASVVDETGAAPLDQNENPATLTSRWYNSSNIQLATGNDTNWAIPSSYEVGPTFLKFNVSSSYYYPAQDYVNVTVYGYVNVSISSPTAGAYPDNTIIDVTCLVKDAGNGQPVSSYPVVISRNGTGLSTQNTNSSGQVNYQINTNTLNEGNHEFECEIGDNATLYYNKTTPYTSSVIIDVDKQAPNIDYNPNSDSSGNYSTASIFVNVSASDQNLDAVRLWWNGTIYSFTNSEGNNYWMNVAGLSQGEYVFYAYANDTTGAQNQTANRTVWIDLDTPSVNITVPLNNSYTNTTSTTLEYTASDFTLVTCWYSLNDGPNTSLTTCQNTTVNSLLSGNNNITVYANDTAGRVGSDRVFIIVDQVKPGLTVQSPVNDTEYTFVDVDLNYTVSDDQSVDDCWYSLDGGADQPLAGCANTTLSGLLNSNHNVTVYVNDSAGNINSTTIYFSVNYSELVATPITPENNTVYTTSNVTANVTTNKAATGCNFTLDGGSPTSMGSPDSFVWDYNLTGLSEVTHNISFTCVDASNSSTTDYIYFTVDMTGPVISFENPTPPNDSATSENWTYINVSLSEPGSVAILEWTNASGSYNYTMTSYSTTHFEYNKTGLYDASYTYKVYANDTYGNFAVSETRSLLVSTAEPVVTIHFPIHDQSYSTNVLDLNVTATKTISDWNFTLNGELFDIFSPNISFAAALYGNNLTVYAADELGQTGTASINFTVNNTVQWDDTFGSYTGLNTSSYVNTGTNASISFCWPVFFADMTPQNNPATCWPYRRTLSLSTAATLTDYQVKVNLDLSGLVSSNKLQADCSDLRFAYANVSSESESAISHWIEDCSDTSNVTAWVKIPRVNDSTELYMYYGNEYVDDASNGSAVFELFDEFDNIQTSDWGSNAANWDSTNNESYPTVGGSTSKITSTYSFPTSYATELWIKGNSSSGSAGYYTAGTSSKYVRFFLDPNNNRINFYTGSNQYYTTNASTYQKYTILTDFSSNNYSLYINDSYTAAVSSSSSASGANLNPVFYSYYNRGLFIDRIAVRKYSSNHPSLGSLGSETTPVVNASLRSEFLSPESFGSWDTFTVLADLPSGTNAIFRLVNESGFNICGNLTYANVSSGYDVCAAAGNKTLALEAELTTDATLKTPSILNWSVNWSTNISAQPDLVIVSINLSETNLVEGNTIDVQVLLNNSGTAAANNFRVQLNRSLYNESVNLEYVDNSSLYSLAAGSSLQVNFTWTVDIGTHIFDAYVDYLGVVSESTETNNFLLYNETTSAWQIFNGNVSYFIKLTDGLNETVYNWSTSTEIGKFFYSDTDSSYYPFNLHALNETGDFDQADQALGIGGYSDSIRNLFDTNGDNFADQSLTLEIGGTYMTGVPYINSTNTSSFITAILWDSADPGASYDGSQDLVFVTLINVSKVGEYGTYDYEIRLPSTLGSLFGGADIVKRIDELA